MLTPRLISEIIRQRMGSKDDSSAARIIIAIPTALKSTARKVAADPMLRPLLITEKSTTTLAIATGVVDLTLGYSQYHFLLEDFDLGNVYLTGGNGVPMQRLRSPQQAPLNNYLGQVFLYFYVQGDKLYVLPSSTTGTLSFAVPYFPTTVAQLPDSEEVENIFFQEIMNLLSTPAGIEP